MLIPLKVDVPMSRGPWVNYALMGVIVVVSIYGFYDLEFLCELAGIEIHYTYGLGSDVSGSSLTTEHLPLPVLAVTSTLLHGGWLHLIGNMLFLWIFGNAANYKFGHLGYIGLYLAAALAGGMVHYGYGGGPIVGASGAIYGVMGAFVVFFPRNDVTVFWFIWMRLGIGRISSIWIILFWVAWDIIYLALGANMGVAFWGHIGGFCAGLSIGLTCALVGWIKPTQDEQTLLQLIGVRR